MDSHEHGGHSRQQNGGGRNATAVLHVGDLHYASEKAVVERVLANPARASHAWRRVEDWARPLLRRRSARRRLWQRRLSGWLGLRESVTVVATTRFIRPADWPAARDEQERVLGVELDASLEFLNDFLVGLSLVRNEPRLLPIARGDLPIVCPVILELVAMPFGERVGASFGYPIHADVTYVGFGQRHNDAEFAAEIARSNYHGREPYFLFYELMQRSLQAFNSARFAQAMLLIGTAIEVMIAVTIRESSKLHGEPPTRAERILIAGLKNVVDTHLARYANIAVDLKNSANPAGRWFQGGYALRNQVAHEGHKPSERETRSAFDDAWP